MPIDGPCWVWGLGVDRVLAENHMGFSVRVSKSYRETLLDLVQPGMN